MDLNVENLAFELIPLIGGKDNIKNLFNCMTRLRFVPLDDELVNIAAIKKCDHVMDIVKVGQQFQIIVGPGTAGKLCDAMKKLTGPIGSSTLEASNDSKTMIKNRYKNPLGEAAKTIGAIFVPLIPAFIACGLLLGLSNFLKNPAVSGDFSIKFPDLVAFISILGGSVFFYMNAIVGYNASKEFGGSPALGVAFAGVLYAPGLAGLTLFGEALIPGRGGIIAILIVCWFGSLIEKQIRKVVPNALDLFLTPFITLIMGGGVAIAVLQPIGGFLSDAISNGSAYLISIGGPFVGFIMAGLFLPLVMTGIHQGLTPIMLDMLEKTGVNLLLPILAMAGAGQVGASIAVLVKTKNNRLKKTIKSALPAGMMGVGEPLIYGVTLPLGKPFLGACIGGAFGGAVIGIFKVAAVVPGALSGLVLSAGIVPTQVLAYLLAVAVAYVAGYFATIFLGFVDPVEE